jgi:hypothetical protein
LIDQHLIERNKIAAPDARFQSRQGRAAAQLLTTTYCRLHQRIGTQLRMVVEVFIATGQCIQALGNEIAQGMRDKVRVTRIMNNSGCRC